MMRRFASALPALRLCRPRTYFLIASLVLAALVIAGVTWKTSGSENAGIWWIFVLLALMEIIIGLGVEITGSRLDRDFSSIPPRYKELKNNHHLVEALGIALAGSVESTGERLAREESPALREPVQQLARALRVDWLDRMIAFRGEQAFNRMLHEQSIPELLRPKIRWGRKFWRRLLADTLAAMQQRGEPTPALASRHLDILATQLDRDAAFMLRQVLKHQVSSGKPEAWIACQIEMFNDLATRLDTQSAAALPPGLREKLAEELNACMTTWFATIDEPLAARHAEAIAMARANHAEMKAMLATEATGIRAHTTSESTRTRGWIAATAVVIVAVSITGYFLSETLQRDRARESSSQLADTEQRIVTEFRTQVTLLAETTEEIVRQLRDELRLKNDQIVFLQHQVQNAVTLLEPSERARELAALIPDDASAYARALKAIAERDFDTARALLDEATEQQEAELAAIYVARAETESYAGRWPAAVEWYERALALRPDDPSLWGSAGTALMQSAQFDRAEELFHRDLADAEQRYGVDHAELVPRLNSMATVTILTNRLQEGEELARRAVAIAEAIHGPDAPEITHSLHLLAGVCVPLVKLEEAEALMHRALTINESHLGPDHPDVARDLRSLAIMARVRSDYEESEVLLRRSIAIIENHHGATHPEAAASRLHLAEVLLLRNKVQEGEQVLREAQEILIESMGEDHPLVGTCAANLGFVLQSQNRNAEAEPLIRRSLEIYEKSLGENHPVMGNILSHLGILFMRSGRIAEAEQTLQRSLEVYESALGPDHPVVALGLNNLGFLYMQLGRLDEAESMLRRAQMLIEKDLGPDSSDLGEVLSSLSIILMNTNRLEEAKVTMERALAICESAFGTENPMYGRFLNNLGWIEVQLGHLDEGMPKLRQALRVLTMGEHDPYDPVIQQVRTNLTHANQLLLMRQRGI